MDKVLGILIMIAGVALPLAMVGWLAVRLNRKPAPPARLTGLVLAFNGVLPVGLVLVGLGLLAPSFWALSWVRVAAWAALAVAAIILVALLAGGRPAGTAGDRNDR